MSAAAMGRSSPAPVPLTLITGFLGSGKTTLINAVLRNSSFSGTMVIINEFGDVGLDHLLVSTAKDQVVLLDSGCLCCMASGSLRDTLIDLFVRRASGEVPNFDRIIIETSGLAHPGPLVASVLGDSALRPRCALSQVLTLVDAANGVETLKHYAEARHQVAFADTLLISKIDTAQPAQINALRTTLTTMNAQAPITTWGRDQSAAEIFSDSALDVASGAGRQRPEAWLRRPLFTQEADGSLRGPHGKDFMKIRSYVLRSVGSEIDWGLYAKWTQAASTKLGKRLLRCKGLLPLGDGDAPWVVQGVQGYFAPPRKLAAWPPEIGHGFLVCIGDGVSLAELDALMESSPFQSPSS